MQARLDAFQVKGRSMEPTLLDGDLVFVQPVADLRQVNVGDIVVLHMASHPEPVCHRVLCKDSTEKRFWIQGDAAGEIDRVEADAVQGAMFKVHSVSRGEGAARAVSALDNFMQVTRLRLLNLFRKWRNKL